MGVLERLRNMVRANVSDIAARAEDPEAQLDKLLKRMSQDLEDASAEITAAVRDERRLSDELMDHQYRAKMMEEKAGLAVVRGDDELAREALHRKSQHAHRAEQIEKELKMQRDGVGALRDHLDALEAKIVETRRYRDFVLARRRLAAAQEGVTKKLGTRQREALEEIQATVIELQASTLAAQDELETRLSVIEQRARDGAEDDLVEEELRAMKQRRPDQDRRGDGGG